MGEGILPFSPETLRVGDIGNKREHSLSLIYCFSLNKVLLPPTLNKVMGPINYSGLPITQ